MAEEQAQAEESPDTPSEVDSVRVSYTEANDYKTVYADGAQGNFTRGGKLFLHFYVEFPVLPKNVVHAVDDEGNLGEPLEPHDDVTLERRRECGVILDPQTLVELYDWLGRKLSELEAMAEEFPSAAAPADTESDTESE